MDSLFTAELTYKDDNGNERRALLQVSDEMYQFFYWLKHRGHIKPDTDLRVSDIFYPSDGVEI